MDNNDIVEILADIMCYNPGGDSLGRSYVPIYPSWVERTGKKYGIDMGTIISRQQEMLRAIAKRMWGNE